MRLKPESLKVESFPTQDVPEQVGHASSDTRENHCSGWCDLPTCIYEVCDR
jgi:hypothetical protein